MGAMSPPGHDATNERSDTLNITDITLCRFRKYLLNALHFTVKSGEHFQSSEKESAWRRIEPNVLTERHVLLEKPSLRSLTLERAF